MLLIDDNDRLSIMPGEEELELAKTLGSDMLSAIDETILSVARPRWLKAARVVFDAIEAGGYVSEEPQVQLHLRRIIALAESGRIESQGNLYRPRFSEIRLPGGDL